MDDCILIDDDEETAGNRDAVLARKLAGHGEGSVTAQTSESLSCPFCPFLVENHDRLSVMQEHVENVHLSFGEEASLSFLFGHLNKFLKILIEY